MKDDRENEEFMNKEKIKYMWLLLITTVIVYIVVLFVAVYILREGPRLGIIIGVSTTIVVAIAFYGLKLEVEAGYYECKNCHHKYVPTYFDAMMAPHMATTRYLKCPNCNKRTWSKKVMSK